MKKEVTVKISARKASTSKKTVTLCDFCGKKLRGYGSYGHSEKCCLCGRDICHDHTQYDPNELGDYPGNYCTICYRLRYIVHEADYDKVEDDYEKALSHLDEEIKAKSLNTRIIK